MFPSIDAHDFGSTCMKVLPLPSVIPSKNPLSKGRKFRGQVGTNNFDRYNGPSQHTGYLHKGPACELNTTRAVGFAIGWKKKIKSSEPGQLSESFEQPLAGSLLFSPKKNFYGVQSSSTQKNHTSPLAAEILPIDFASPHVICSGWVCIPASSVRKRRKDKGLPLTHIKNTNPEIQSSAASSYDYSSLMEMSDPLLELYLSASKLSPLQLHSLNNSDLKEASSKSKKIGTSLKKSNKRIKGGSAEDIIRKFITDHPVEANNIPFLSKRDPKKNPFEWAHIMAKSLQSSTQSDPENLVAMSKHMNTWMLYFETMAKILATTYKDHNLVVYVRSTVRVNPLEPNLAETLHYQLRCYYKDTCYIEFDRCFNISADDHKFLAPRVSDKRITCAAFDKLFHFIKQQPLNAPFLTEEQILVRCQEFFDGLEGYHQETDRNIISPIKSLDQTQEDNFMDLEFCPGLILSVGKYGDNRFKPEQYDSIENIYNSCQHSGYESDNGTQSSVQDSNEQFLLKKGRTESANETFSGKRKRSQS